ncbi:hypothetical protein BDD12DRAFT_804131 [Trichophaea hybrida]|nr:hypothetical protein BDD12DRAFT_804131 [Trichophaea hybrida]
MRLYTTLLVAALLATVSPYPIVLSPPDTSSSSLTKRLGLRAKTNESSSHTQWTNSLPRLKLEWDPREWGCINAPDYGFEDSCLRHDFGFKNYRKQGRLCRDTRKSLDWRFYMDMNNFCEKKY